MRVTLMRHYKVGYSWKRRYAPEGFRIAQHEYDKAGVIDQAVKLQVHFQKVIISNLRRTSLTMECALGHCDHLRTDLLNEVPMALSRINERNTALQDLTVMARIQWLFNSHRQTKSRKDSTRRAHRFIGEYLWRTETA